MILTHEKMTGRKNNVESSLKSGMRQKWLIHSWYDIVLVELPGVNGCYFDLILVPLLHPRIEGLHFAE